MSELKGLIAQAASQMEKTVEHLEEALARVRAGKANVKILDGIMVEYYGSPVPLTQVGTVTIPDAKSIVITPWEKGIIRDIERAIINSPLGITPENNGELIRLGIPPAHRRSPSRTRQAGQGRRRECQGKRTQCAP